MNTTDEESDVLQYWSDSENKKLSQRAKIIISYNQGDDYSDISKVLNISKRSACLWINRYKEKGLAGLVDNERSGRKSMKLSKQKEILSFLNNDQSNKDMYKLVEKVGVSKDTIWRKSRIGGYKINRQKIFNLHEISFSKPAVESELVGLFFTPYFTISAFQIWKNKKAILNIKYKSVWNRPAKIVRGILHTPIELDLIDCLKASSSHPNKLKIRAINEEWQKWINSLRYSMPPVSDGLHFMIAGEIDRELVLKTIRDGQKISSIKFAKNKISISASLFPSYDKWLDKLSDYLSNAYEKNILTHIKNNILEQQRNQLFFSWFRVPDDWEEINLLANYYRDKKQNFSSNNT